MQKNALQNILKLNKIHMQTWNLSQTLHGHDFSIICLPDKHVNYDKLTFSTKQRILYIDIVNHIKYNQ